ncbi:hypothetical protein LYZ37_14885 [Vibrio tubiashii]|uniref:hypothetical protein n=1 Tax=Vibrio tubiashii TaxID=29498 RepID=UPI00234F7DA5|nr:hypothetical protein [Vibrio tubiashii]WCP67083.1 hypothetical protein LYZ37_14885 [Vibrio tubiashii]
MAKRFCKMNRKQIAENLGDIHRLVVEPKYLCRSCARSSASKDSLCKPAAIPPQACQNKPLEQQQSCALLAEALPADPVNQTSEQKAQAVRRVVEKVKEKALLQKAQLQTSQAETVASEMFDLEDKKALKKAKKAIKKHYKQQKKLLKIADKQRKLLKKQKKLESKASLSRLIAQRSEAQASSNLH